MKTKAYCLFDTALGCCGIAWLESGNSLAPTTVCYFQLPESNAESTEAKIRRACKGQQANPPPEMIEVIQKVSRHFDGEIQDFQNIAVDLQEIGSFAQQVYVVTRGISAGQTKTYGEIAWALNRPRAARAVGQALGRNPIALIIPCHRVLAAAGKPGGFSAHGGVNMKARMLALEGFNLQT
jgi:methylated-DNA-[protein]-cysteine S-methyltransferase